MDKNIEAGSPATYWLNQIVSAGKREQKWLDRAKKVISRYRDERENERSGDSKVNILWSNTEVLKSALFTKVGNPDVRRKFTPPGMTERVARTAAMVLENSLVASASYYGMADEIKAAVEDMLLPGRGNCWIELTGEKTQEVKACYVGWEDFRHGSAKRWNDVPWVARRHYFSPEDIAKNFPDYKDQITYSSIDSDGKKEDDSAKRTSVWEIWDRGTMSRIYICDGCTLILRSDEDPYKLQDFFPCPKPLYGVTTTNSLIPIPEFVQWQDQAQELDRINTRIQKLTETLKYSGGFDKKLGDTDTLANLGSLEDGQFIPMNLTGHDQTLANAFMVRDLQPIIITLNGLVQNRESIKQTIYEITGVSDIMRGQGQEYETAAAQEIKARAGTQRFSDKHRAVQDFVRDLMAMKAEIMAEHFSREQLEAMTGIPLPLAADQDKARALLAQGAQAQAAQGQAAQIAKTPQAQAMAQAAPQLAQAAMQMLPQDPLAGAPPEVIEHMKLVANAVTWEAVSGILRSDDRRNYSITVETDITAFEDSEADKQQALDFMDKFSGYLQLAVPLIQQKPGAAPMLKEIFLSVVSKFKFGRSVQDAIEQGFDALMQPSPPTPPPVDPTTQFEIQKLQAEVQMAHIRAQKEQQLAQMEIEKETQLMQLKIQKAQMDLEAAKQDASLKMAASIDERQNKAADAELKSLQIQLNTTKVLANNQKENAADPLKAAYDKAIANGTFVGPFEHYLASGNGNG